MKTENCIVEIKRGDGQYGMTYTHALIDHPEHGRLLIMDGYGGEDQLRGGQYRWEHGCVIRLQPGDTLESLEAGAWNDATSLLDAVVHGCDDTRPFARWDGHAIASLAKSLGL